MVHFVIFSIDIDECADPETNDCDRNAECINTEGSYTCSCNVGYTGDSKTCKGVCFFSKQIPHLPYEYKVFIRRDVISHCIVLFLVLRVIVVSASLEGVYLFKLFSSILLKHRYRRMCK